jgi:NADPH:quinone reductase-like Zn-dependent oxidoreductase
MKAVFITEHGGSDRLTLGDLPDPTPARNEVVVRVRACAVNHIDLWVRQGLPFLKVHFPHILGGDISGEVIATGLDARGWQLGQRVVVNGLISCGRCLLCLSGRDNLCRRAAIIGEDLPGGYAEFVKVPNENLVPLADSISFESAAAVGGVFVTAWAMLFNKARLRPGEWVLIHSVGSGVGSAAAQLALLTGANVIGTCGTDKKMSQAAKMGIKHLIHSRERDFLREVRRITAKSGVDVIIEHIGEDVWARSLCALAPGGRLVTCGSSSGHHPRIDLRRVFYEELQIQGVKFSSKAALFRILRLLEAGRVSAVIDRVLPLSAARDAHQALANREVFGKIVLVPERGRIEP